MDDLDHLPLPPDEPRNQTDQPVQLTPLPLEFVQPLIPPPPVVVPIAQSTISTLAVTTRNTPVKKVRLRAVLATVFVGLIGIVLSGSAAVYFIYSKLPSPLSQRRAKPVIRVHHPAVPPPMVETPGKVKGHLKSHPRKTARKKSKTKPSPAENSTTNPQHKPWFSNSNQKGA